MKVLDLRQLGIGAEHLEFLVSFPDALREIYMSGIQPNIFPQTPPNNNNIRPEGAVAVARRMPRNLLKLSLSWNQILDAATTALA